jgi:hypothetical protein
VPQDCLFSKLNLSNKKLVILFRHFSQKKKKKKKNRNVNKAGSLFCPILEAQALNKLEKSKKSQGD